MLAMECTKIGSGNYSKFPPTPPQRKYVSVFCIDGVPILPPLMTTERRRKMRKLKQKAIEVEQQLAENHRKKLQFADEAIAWKVQQRTPEQMAKNVVIHGDECNSARSNKSSISQNSVSDFQVDDSYLLLSSLMQSNQQESKKFTDFGTSTNNESNVLERNVEERMQKLRKSETLIYDNCSNAIIMSISNLENLEQTADEENIQRNLEASKQDVCSLPKCDYRPLSKTQIPSICVNPPTPLTGTRNFSDSISTSENETNKSIVQKHCVSTDDLSTDESMNISYKNCALSPKQKTSTIIASKILKFESLQSEKNSITQTPRKSLEAACTKPPQRSATSPLLKPNSSINQNKHLLKNSISAGATDSNSIVRSNSFTLDTPSKALLEHLKQQKADIAVSPLSVEYNKQQQPVVTKRNTPLNNCALRSALSASATRDTVESKAKRVQKVELKPRTSQMRLNTKSMSTSGSYTLSNKSSSILLNKSINKPRSPYDYKTTTKIKNKTQTNTPVALIIKTVKPTPTGAPTALITTTPVKSNHNNCYNSSNNNQMVNYNIYNNNNNCSNNNSNSNSNSSNKTVRCATKTIQSGILNEIEAEHRQKFAQLIAQQHEEQKRLQMAFEAQQKQLIEQLSSNIDKVQLTTTSTTGRSSNESSPTKSTSCAPNSDRCDSILNTTNSPTLSLISSSALSQSICDLTILEDTSCAASSKNTYASNCSGRTPRRRLFDQAAGSSVNAAQNSMITNMPTNRRLQHQLENQRRIAAATIICAYARGFLTRRLFQTEQIQRIVQTIRDTLIFVLNLHMETLENPVEANTSANIKLKARLLQQLSSASRTLHLVFFQTTIKDRMEIISRDRKRIKTKLLSLNLKRSPRIVA